MKKRVKKYGDDAESIGLVKIELLTSNSAKSATGSAVFCAEFS